METINHWFKQLPLKQKRLLKAAGIGFAILFLLTLISHHQNTAFPTQHASTRTTIPIEDEASLDTAEESLSTVAIEYKRTTAVVEALKHQQEDYQHKTTQTLTALQNQTKQLTQALQVIE